MRGPSFLKSSWVIPNILRDTKFCRLEHLLLCARHHHHHWALHACWWVDRRHVHRHIANADFCSWRCETLNSNSAQLHFQESSDHLWPYIKSRDGTTQSISYIALTSLNLLRCTAHQVCSSNIFFFCYVFFPFYLNRKLFFHFFHVECIYLIFSKTHVSTPSLEC